MMSNAQWRRSAHMNNGQFEIPRIQTTRRVVPNTGIYKLLEQQTNSANPIPAGEIMGAVRVGIASRFTRVVCAKCANRWKIRCFSVVLSYRFTVNKMILEISIRVKTSNQRTT